MRLVSTTLTGNARTHIADALRSVVDWVDACIVIDTGVTDDTLDVARSIAGEKLVVRTFPWIEDFAAARNFALQAATEAGADWAITLDTDERILLRGIDIRAALATQTAGALLVEIDTREYAKERILRLPTTIQWTGPTHEALQGLEAVGTATLQGLFFHELPKDAAAIKRKLDRDIEILLRHTKRHPRDPRWHYYLGDSLRQAGRHREAIAAYEACAALRGWNEEAAWACYQAAQCHTALGDLHRAVDSCATGLARHAGIAELPWLAAYTSHKLGNHAQAVYWARLAIPWGSYLGNGKIVPRIGFRHPPGLYEGPYDVLRFALATLGDEAGAEEAEHHYQLARLARLRLTSGPGREPSVEEDLTSAIHSYYVGRLDEGAAACERLLARPLEPEQELRARRARSWYTKTLATLVSARFTRLDEPAHEGGSCFDPTILAHAPHIAHGFRPGSQLVPVDGGSLALVHEAVTDDAGRHIHEHRFVRFDENLAIASYSPPFYFREIRTLELAVGLAIADDRLVASFSVRDTEAWQVELDLHEVLALTSRQLSPPS